MCVCTRIRVHSPVLFGALAAVEFRGGAGPWPPGTSRTQQGGRRQAFFKSPCLSASLSPLSFVFLFTLLPPLFTTPSVAHCLKSPLPSFTSCNSKCREVIEGYPHTCSTHTDKHASMKERPLKALRQQKQQAAVCGLIAPTGCGIIELDMSDRSVSRTQFSAPMSSWRH